MKSHAKVILNFPDPKKRNNHFTLRLKQEICNEPCEYKMPPKILAVSDIEGNFMALLKLFLKYKVVDKSLNWTFDEGHVVVVGDCFDRGEQVVECLWLIYSLEEKARKQGGYVHFILGNHEVMNMNGDWRFVHPSYARSSRVPYTALYDGNNQLWRWLCTKNIVEKIGDILFVHGGISQELLDLRLSVPEINSKVRPWLNNAHGQFSEPLLKVVFNSEKSPFWYRGYYRLTASDLLVKDTLQHFEVNTIVTGHTVVEKVAIWYNGSIINVNTDHGNGNSQALLIRKGKFYRVGSKTRMEKIK